MFKYGLKLQTPSPRKSRCRGAHGLRPSGRRPQSRRSCPSTVAPLRSSNPKSGGLGRQEEGSNSSPKKRKAPTFVEAGRRPGQTPIHLINSPKSRAKCQRFLLVAFPPTPSPRKSRCRGAHGLRPSGWRLHSHRSCPSTAL